MIKTFFQIVFFVYWVIASLLAFVLALPIFIMEKVFPEIIEPTYEFIYAMISKKPEDEEMERE